MWSVLYSITHISGLFLGQSGVRGGPSDTILMSLIIRKIYPNRLWCVVSASCVCASVYDSRVVVVVPYYRILALFADMVGVTGPFIRFRILTDPLKYKYTVCGGG